MPQFTLQDDEFHQRFEVESWRQPTPGDIIVARGPFWNRMSQSSREWSQRAAIQEGSRLRINFMRRMTQYATSLCLYECDLLTDLARREESEGQSVVNRLRRLLGGGGGAALSAGAGPGNREPSPQWVDMDTELRRREADSIAEGIRGGSEPIPSQMSYSASYIATAAYNRTFMGGMEPYSGPSLSGAPAQSYQALEEHYRCPHCRESLLDDVARIGMMRPAPQEVVAKHLPKCPKRPKTEQEIIAELNKQQAKLENVESKDFVRKKRNVEL